MQFIRVFAALLAFAATSALASPIPFDSLSKKEPAPVEFAREFETPDSELEIVARDPEDVDVEVREPCVPRSCG